jgi:hypothetical protein
VRDSKKVIDFLVIGAQKAGTTSLFEYLKGHPDVYLPPGKEVPYFSLDRVWNRGWDEYISNTFGRADPAKQWGTVTTHYMVGGVYDAANCSDADSHSYDERTVPLRIHERLPTVRLIALLRDPIQRAISHHRMLVLNRREKRSFDDAIDQLLALDALDQARQYPDETTGYVVWGEYGRILQGYFSVFPAEQVLLLFTSELDSKPDELLRRIYDFLAISPSYMPANLDVRYRMGNNQRKLSWLNIAEARRVVAHTAGARTAWRALPRAIRHPVDRAFERTSYKVDLWNQRDAPLVEPPSSETLHRLSEHYEEDTAHLLSLTGLTPPWVQAV